jgi:hypothetical protein
MEAGTMAYSEQQCPTCAVRQGRGAPSMPQTGKKGKSREIFLFDCGIFPQLERGSLAWRGADWTPMAVPFHGGIRTVYTTQGGPLSRKQRIGRA